MSKTIGPYRLNPRGDYNPAADPLYSLLDLVSNGGGSFVYINDTPSNEPTSSTSHWQQIASMGGQDLVDAAVAARDAAAATAAQLETAYEYRTIQSVQNFGQQRQTLVTFVDDDGRTDVMTKLKPLSDTYGIPFVVAAISDRIGVFGNVMTSAQLLDLQVAGWEISSHTKTHAQLGTLTDAEQEAELSESKAALEAMGLHVSTVCYPYSNINDKTYEIARKYYRAGRMTNRMDYINDIPLETWDLRCTPVGSYFETNSSSGLSTDSLEYYKYQVDRAVAGKNWLIFMTHCGEAAHDATQQQHLIDLIEYVQSLNIPIVTMSQALNLIGNVVDTGRYEREHPNYEHYCVGVDGTVRGSDNVNKLRSIYADNSTPPNAFEIGYNYYSRVRQADSSGLPDSPAYGGTIYTQCAAASKLDYSEGYLFQEYMPRGRFATYKRYALSSTEWSPWVTSNGFTNLSSASLTLDSPASSFPVGILSGVIITSNATVGKMPEATAGLLVTDRRSQHNYYITQTYYPSEKSTAYIRGWSQGTTSWGGWVSLSSRAASTAGRNNSSYPKSTGDSVFDTTLGKPIWWDGTKYVDATGTAV